MKFELQTTNIHNGILIRRITPSQPQGRATTTWLLKCHLQHLDFESSLLLPGNPQADVFLANNSEQRLYLKIHLSTLLIQIVCSASCYRKNGEIQIKEQIPTLRSFLKDPFCARELELGLNVPLKSVLIKLRILPFWFFTSLTCYVNIFYVMYTATLREKKSKPPPLSALLIN